LALLAGVHNRQLAGDDEIAAGNSEGVIAGAEIDHQVLAERGAADDIDLIVVAFHAQQDAALEGTGKAAAIDAIELGSRGCLDGYGSGFALQDANDIGGVIADDKEVGPVQRVGKHPDAAVKDQALFQDLEGGDAAEK
jgi:hypothetical protein